MNPTQPLTGSHLRTYERIFAHPISHNLDWREVLALLEKLGQVVEKDDGSLIVTRNGHTRAFHPPRHGENLDNDAVMQLRHFIAQTEAPPPAEREGESHWLVVIDHHEARIFQSEMKGSTPLRLLPHKPEDHFRHEHNSKDFSRGRDKPDPNSFFEPIAQRLRGATKILVIGSGKGTGSEMGQFVGWLERHHPELARRVVGNLVVDQHHLSEAQVMAKAREFYATLATAPH